MHMIYGSQRHPYDYHKNGWDEDRLKKDLLSVGFKDVRRWNWQDISPHSYCDDYSQAYSPHMDKENGMLMSLNVEAIKEELSTAIGTMVANQVSQTMDLQAKEFKSSG